MGNEYRRPNKLQLTESTRPRNVRIVKNSEIHPLHYAPRPSWNRRYLGRIAVLLAILSVLALSPRWGPRLWRRVQVLYWQQKCLSYQPPRGQIIFRANNDHVSGSVIALPWLALYSRLSPPGFISQGTAFLHERVSPGGNRRLVAVDVYLFATNLASSTEFNARVLSLGGLKTEPNELGSSFQNELGIGGEPIEVCAGVADPLDQSHFTFQVKTGGGRLVVHGWLLDNDQVKFDARLPMPPATQPAP